MHREEKACDKKHDYDDDDDDDDDDDSPTYCAQFCPLHTPHHRISSSSTCNSPIY